MMHIKGYTTTLLATCLLLGGCATTGAGASDSPTVAGATAPATTRAAPAASALKTRLSPQEQRRFLQDYAQLLLASGRHAQAQNLLETLHRAQPDELQPLRLLAYAYEAEERPGLALLAWERLLQQSRATSDEAEYARLALVNNRFALAEGIYRGWLERDGASTALRVTALNNLGYSKLLQGEMAAARLHFEQALQLDPLDRRARGNLAISHEIAGQPELASAEWRILGRDNGANKR